MAKKKAELNKTEVQKRKDKVAACVQCKGDPPTHEANLQGIICNICNECGDLVGDWRKEGEPIKIEKKIAISTPMQDPNFSRNQEIKVDTVPGKKGFSNLELL